MATEPNCSRENSINLSLSQEPRLNDKKPQTFLKAGHTIQILSKISIPSTWRTKPLRNNSDAGTPFQSSKLMLTLLLHARETTADPLVQLQMGKKTIWPRLHRLCNNAQLKGKAPHTHNIGQLQSIFMAIPCARDHAIDAACGLYQFFLRHWEIPCIVSSDCSTHFKEVYRRFCKHMSITQEAPLLLTSAKLREQRDSTG